MSDQLATISSTLALATMDAGTLAGTIQENLGGMELSPNDLDRVRVPAGGGVVWELPDGEPTKELVGVIVHHNITRSYWATSFDEREEGESPACYSNDGVTGYGDIGDGADSRPCAGCPLNVFGSGRGNAKACQEARLVYLLRPGELLPIVLRLPATSLRDFQRYMLRLTSKGVPYYTVITSFTLERTKNSQGTAYAKVLPSMVETLSPEMVERVQTYAGMIRSAIAREPAPIESN